MEPLHETYELELDSRRKEISELCRQLKDLQTVTPRPKRYAKKVRDLREHIKLCRSEYASLMSNINSNFT